MSPSSSPGDSDLDSPWRLFREKKRIGENELCHPYLGRRHHRNFLEVVVRHAGGGAHEETWRRGGPDFRRQGWAGLPLFGMTEH